jgi:hypothetical protein
MSTKLKTKSAPGGAPMPPEAPAVAIQAGMMFKWWKVRKADGLCTLFYGVVDSVDDNAKAHVRMYNVEELGDPVPKTVLTNFLVPQNPDQFDDDQRQRLEKLAATKPQTGGTSTRRKSSKAKAASKVAPLGGGLEAGYGRTDEDETMAGSGLDIGADEFGSALDAIDGIDGDIDDDLDVGAVDLSDEEDEDGGARKSRRGRAPKGVGGRSPRVAKPRPATPVGLLGGIGETADDALQKRRGRPPKKAVKEAEKLWKSVTVGEDGKAALPESAKAPKGLSTLSATDVRKKSSLSKVSLVSETPESVPAGDAAASKRARGKAPQAEGAKSGTQASKAPVAEVKPVSRPPKGSTPDAGPKTPRGAKDASAEAKPAAAKAAKETPREAKPKAAKDASAEAKPVTAKAAKDASAEAKPKAAKAAKETSAEAKPKVAKETPAEAKPKAAKDAPALAKPKARAPEAAGEMPGPSKALQGDASGNAAAEAPNGAVDAQWDGDRAVYKATAVVVPSPAGKGGGARKSPVKVAVKVEPLTPAKAPKGPKAGESAGSPPAAKPAKPRKAPGDAGAEGAAKASPAKTAPEGGGRSRKAKAPEGADADATGTPKDAGRGKKAKPGQPD